MSAGSNEGVSLDDLRACSARGWAVLPIHSVEQGRCSCGRADCNAPGKHPRLKNGVKEASSELAQIEFWLGQYPGANWALATGKRSGVWVLDIDVRENGQANLEAWVAERQVTVPKTRVVRSGGGGLHYYFDAADHLTPTRNRVNWLPGVDVRSDGGYVLLPGSSHVSGARYAVERDIEPTHAPHQLVDDIASRGALPHPAAVPSDGLIGGVGEGHRDDYVFRTACKLRRLLGDDRAAVTLLTLQAAANCTPPFPERDALVKVESAFSQDHSDAFDLDRAPFAAPDGVLYDFLEDLDAETLRLLERGLQQARVRALVARVLREERVAKYGDAAALDGDEFMFGEIAADVPIWGAGDDLLWVEGGGLMIPSDQGLGKSLTAQQIIAGRLGVGPGNLLDLPIARLDPGKVVVYLALDRPRQIARSMARLFRTPAERAIAKARLRIWTKPIPIDILGDAYAFADWIQQEFGDNVGDLVIDSVKDLTPTNLSDGAVGQALDMAWKECRARGMSTLVLHHERKSGGDESRANRQPSLDHIYGSVWLTSGMDSILHISGKQGENLVRYTHLKAIINMLDPIDAVHDQENGRTDVLALTSNATGADAKIEQVYQTFSYATSQGEALSSLSVSKRSGVKKVTVDRCIKKLIGAGRIIKVSPYMRGTGDAATYCAAMTGVADETTSANRHHWEPITDEEKEAAS